MTRRKFFKWVGMGVLAACVKPFSLISLDKVGLSLPNISGDISPRTAGHVVAKLFKRSRPHMALERFGQDVVPQVRKTIRFRRYGPFPPATVSMVEGMPMIEGDRHERT